jgi:hypothetical protein
MNPPTRQGGRGCVARSAGCIAGLMFGALMLSLFIVLFYAEEDWRGAQAWQRAQDDWKKRGVSLDPRTYTPALIPDSENFGALPFFNEVPVVYPGGTKAWMRLALAETLKPVGDHLPISKDDGSKSDSLPYLGNWQKGDAPDLKAVQGQLETFYRHQHPGNPIPSNATPSDIFTLICPVLAELRATNATHPLCRFAWDYESSHPWDVELGGVTDHIRIAQVLAYDERLALLSHRQGLSLADLQVTWKMESGLRKIPTLVSNLVAIGVVAIQMGVVNEGLAGHAWDDQQLTALDNDLGQLDDLSQSQFALRTEAVHFFIPTFTHFSTHRSAWINQMTLEKTLFGEKTTWQDLILRQTYRLIPQGWFDFNKAAGVNLLLGGTQMTDPASRRVYPDRQKALISAIHTNAVDFWSDSGLSELPSLLNSVSKFACLQSQLDEGRISCRLERYRLTHGTYPRTLDELVPAFGADLPRDMMNGEEYHYKLNSDQTYILYSVGWNQKDDNGDGGSGRNSDSPDWIWTNYPNQKPGK